MEVKVFYSEIEKLVVDKFGKSVKLEFVSEDVVKIGVPVDMIFKKVNVGVKVKVKELNQVYALMEYSAPYGTNSLVRNSLKLIFKLLGDAEGKVEKIEGNDILINLSKIPQLEMPLKHMEPKHIRFEENHLLLELKLK